MASLMQWPERTLGIGEAQGNLAGCISWGRKELDMTERLNHNSLHPQQTCRKLLPPAGSSSHHDKPLPPWKRREVGDTGACVLLNQGGTSSLQY